LSAKNIFGPDIGALKEEAQVCKPEKVKHLTRSIIAIQEVTIAVDIMFVNKLPYLMSTSSHVRFVTAEIRM